MTTIGVISDTHGLMRPEALVALRGSDLIVHAGDIGSLDVLTMLGELAPLVAVRGNVDRDDWAERLPDRRVVDADGVLLCVLHDVHSLDLAPAAANIRVVISGHSHRPLVRTAGNVLYLNPGSAGPRRFQLPVSVARLVVGAGEPTAEILPLNV